MKKRLNIGIFIDNYYPIVDGVVLVVENLAKELSKDNNVFLVVPDTKIDYKHDGYEVIKVKSIHLPYINYYLGLGFSAYHKLKKINFDVIHIHSPFSIGRLGLKIARKKNIPCICTMHTRFDFEIRRYIKNEKITQNICKNLINVYSKCDRCIAINHKMVEVLESFGYQGTPIIIYNGTDMKCVSDDAKQEINDLYGLNENDILFLFVGRIISIKNIFFIMDVLKELDKDKINFKMFFVGNGVDETRLRHKINEYNLTDKVFILGKILDRNRLAKIYYRSDLFLFPSLFDASSLVQIEAASQKTPTLFIRGSVTSDTITDNYNGFVADNDVISYKNRIIEIINNKRLLNEVASNARKTLARTWSDIALDTYDLYIKEIDKRLEK